MLKLLAALCASSLLVACTENTDSTPVPTSINNSNAASISALGFQQFLALHSNHMLARNTVLASPAYASPCSAGGYSASFNDANNSNSLTVGDSVVENYSSCVLNTGNIQVSGTVSSSVSGFTSPSTYTLSTRHNNLVVTTLGNAKTYTFNGGPIRAIVTNSATLFGAENYYRDYTVSFAGQSTTINSGTAFITVNDSDNSYAIRHSLVFSALGIIGLLRTDTTTDVGGLSVDNELMFAGNTTLSAAGEDAAIQAEKDALALETDNAARAVLEANILALENSRQAFRPFVGRLQIESTFNNQYVEMTSEEDVDDNDPATYQRNVRANRVTTITTGHNWTDLL